MGINYRLLKILFVQTIFFVYWPSNTLGHRHKHVHGDGVQPLSQINILDTKFEVRDKAFVHVSTIRLPTKDDDNVRPVTVTLMSDNPSSDDWVGVFSPAKFNKSTDCKEVGNDKVEDPTICTAPIKYKYANYSNTNYLKSGKAELKFELINQRADFSFALFSGGLSNPKLVAVSDPISVFPNPKAPLYPRIAMGETWDVMTVTWTSGYNIGEAVPFVEWGALDGATTQSPAGTFTYTRNQMCAPPARTVGWRDPGFIHTSYLKDLWPNTLYSYRLGHKLPDGSYVWSKKYKFKSPPVPGESSLQRVVIFGDMGKEPIASVKPFMVASGNHERDAPDAGSFYIYNDSGGECGVPAETTFYVPAKNRAKFWYSADYGMFHFCIADTEHDWRAGSEQYKFLEECLASANRHKQPWLIFAGHRPLSYSSNKWFGMEGSFDEPMGRDDLQNCGKSTKLILHFGAMSIIMRGLALFTRYLNQCVKEGSSHFSGVVNGTIHVVAGGGGSHLNEFSPIKTTWSIYRDQDFGFVKLTAYNYSSLKFEYVKSSDGKIYDSFTISRDYKDVLACVHDSCEPYTLAG
uniref:Purple acid phosphatase n=1 Tax=Chenopodium quinoa TaxID=63459 RepID=A0A803MIE7_CHEQI